MLGDIADPGLITSELGEEIGEDRGIGRVGGHVTPARSRKVAAESTLQQMSFAVLVEQSDLMRILAVAALLASSSSKVGGSGIGPGM